MSPHPTAGLGSFQRTRIVLSYSLSSCSAAMYSRLWHWFVENVYEGRLHSYSSRDTPPSRPRGQRPQPAASSPVQSHPPLFPPPSRTAIYRLAPQRFPPHTHASTSSRAPGWRTPTAHRTQDTGHSAHSPAARFVRARAAPRDGRNRQAAYRSRPQRLSQGQQIDSVSGLTVSLRPRSVS